MFLVSNLSVCEFVLYPSLDVLSRRKFNISVTVLVNCTSVNPCKVSIILKTGTESTFACDINNCAIEIAACLSNCLFVKSVSYTHLTLPTIYSV